MNDCFQDAATRHLQVASGGSGPLSMMEQRADRDRIAGDFSAADILMVDALRVIEAEGQLTDHPALSAYVARATARPAFGKARTDHMNHWHTTDGAHQMERSA